MPRPPSIVGRVNYVIDTWNNPCDAPWVVYLETAGPAALQAFIAVVCFDFLDAVRYIFRPARLRSGRHMRRGQKGQRGRKPKSLGQKLRSKLPGLSALENRKVAQGAKNLWVIDGIGQRLLWWWLVADVASGTLYNWTSALYKTEYCQMSGGPGAGLRETETGNFAAIAGWTAIGYEIFQYNRGSCGMGVFGFSGGPGHWSVAASIDVTGSGSENSIIEMRIAIVTAGGTRYDGHTTAVVGPGSSAGLVTTTTKEGDLLGWVEFRCSYGFPTVNNGAVVCLARPDVPPPPVKYDCFGLKVDQL